MRRLIQMVVACLIVSSIGIAMLHSKEDGADRTQPVEWVIIHTIGGPACNEETKEIFFTPAGKDADYWKADFAARKVEGIHYIVDRKGKIAQGVPEGKIANHAFGSYMSKNINQHSVGIELVNMGDGKDTFPPEQIAALVGLLKKVMSRNPNVQVEDIKSHSEVDDHTRKVKCGDKEVDLKQDPGSKFPWDDVRNKLKE